MHFPCDDVLVAVGQENAFPWIERDAGIAFDAQGMPVVDKVTLASTRPGVFFGGDAAFGPKNIIWAVAHGHDAAISIDNHCQGVPVAQRPAPHVNLMSQKMGIHEWSYDNAIHNDKRYRVPLKDTVIALRDIRAEVELGFDRRVGYAEAQRCLNCDVETVFAGKLCIECDACVDICPMDCITFTARRRRGRPAHAAQRARGESRAGPLRGGRAQDRPRDGEGRGHVPALRPVRRALPDRRLGHAEVPAGHGAGGRSLPPAAGRRHGADRDRIGSRCRGGGVTA